MSLMREQDESLYCALAIITDRIALACLTKRELFAAFAMAGTMANPEMVSSKPVSIAQVAIDQADALIAELEKTTDT